MEFIESDPDYQITLIYQAVVSTVQAENVDLHKLVLQAISKLPGDYRTVITLYHIDECSYREIAEITGMPEGTVKSYISRGRNLLREMLTSLVPDIVDIMNDI